MSKAKRSEIKLGYREYVLFPDDGKRHEIIDGDHYMQPAPSTYHQTVSKRLQYHLYTQVELAGRGTVFDAPVDLQLGPHDIVQPDLLVLLADSRASITPTKVIGPPELVVEILSPSTAENDLRLKRSLYERVGVAEYWIVDPQDQAILVLRWQDGQYVEQPPPGDQLALGTLPDVTIALDQIW